MEFELAIANTQLQMEAMAARLATCAPSTLHPHLPPLPPLAAGRTP